MRWALTEHSRIVVDCLKISVRSLLEIIEELHIRTLEECVRLHAVFLRTRSTIQVCEVSQFAYAATSELRATASTSKLHTLMASERWISSMEMTSLLSESRRNRIPSTPSSAPPTIRTR